MEADIGPRLRAWCDLHVAEAREYGGLHDYDGEIQDLSPDGVRAGLTALGHGPAPHDPHDEQHLLTFERSTALQLGELQLHRRNPLWHIGNLELANYLRPYAPAEEREEALLRHARAWPDAIAAALSALDAVPGPVAEGLLGAARGLVDDLPPREHADLTEAHVAHDRFVAHLEHCATTGSPDARLADGELARMLSTAEAMAVDLGALALRADAERDRLKSILAEACAQLKPGVPMAEAVALLQADHPTIDGVLDEARAHTATLIEWTRASGLFPDHEGECLVGPAPGSRRWAMAMLSPAAPYEADAPSWYQVTPPDPTWPAEEQQDWLAVFNRTSLPAITAHEVAPGHHTHFRLVRTVAGAVRRLLHSEAFVEGWAHYVEELLWEVGFADGDPAYAAGMALEALVRVTRLAVAVGLHTGSMDLAEATARFTADAFLHGPAARSEAVRATLDPTYGRYTWGKLEILALRDEARTTWGAGYSHRRFHTALLELGAPPLGLMRAALAHTGERTNHP